MEGCASSQAALVALDVEHVRGGRADAVAGRGAPGLDKAGAVAGAAAGHGCGQQGADLHHWAPRIAAAMAAVIR